MELSEIEFIGARYHDIVCGLYSDTLPDGYHEKNGVVYLTEENIETKEIVVINT